MQRDVLDPVHILARGKAPWQCRVDLLGVWSCQSVEMRVCVYGRVLSRTLARPSQRLAAEVGLLAIDLEPDVPANRRDDVSVP